MDNYVAIVVDDEQKAFQALHKLWNLDDAGDIEVKGAAVVHRDALGRIQVVSKDIDPGAYVLRSGSRPASLSVRLPRPQQ